MMLNFGKKFLLLASSVFLFALGLDFSSNTSFAEGDTYCASRFRDTSSTGVVGFNPNAGRNYFDAHSVEGSNVNEGGADLSIVLGFDPVDGSAIHGPAPITSHYAACLEGASGSSVDANVENDIDVFSSYQADPTQFGYTAGYELKAEYEARGYFWNDNWGFISMFCKDGENLSGVSSGQDYFGNPLDYSCGGIDYGVYLGPEERDPLDGTKTVRYLFGYAWGEDIGWVQFKGESGAISYGVYMDEDGYLKGHAWTEAGIYLSFEGARIDLVDSDEPITTIVQPGDPNASYCDRVNSSPICVEVSPNPKALVYEDAGGADYMVADCIEGYTVRIVARDAVGNPLTIVPEGATPVAGEVSFSSLTVAWEDTLRLNQINQPVEFYSFSQLKEPINSAAVNGAKGAVVSKPLEWADFERVEEGVYESRSKVTSCAPTSDGNVSFTTSTNPEYTVPNEEFIVDIGVGNVRPNNLRLKHVQYGELVDSAGDAVYEPGVAYANGRSNLALKFKPAVEVNTLYEGDNQDAFKGIINVPNFFRFAVRKNSNSLRIADILDTAEVGVVMQQPNCESGDLGFLFNTDIDGNEAENPSARIGGLVADLLRERTISAVPTGDCGQDIVENPSVYTKVRYQLENDEVSYYSNKLPRVASDPVFNFFAFVVGKVDAKAHGASKDNTLIVDTSDIVNVNEMEGRINRNLVDLDFVFKTGSSTECTLDRLAEDGGYSFVGSCDVNNFKYKALGNDEHLLYFDNTDVNLAFVDGGFGGKWNIVVQGGAGNDGKGNIFIRNDIYNDDPSGKFLNLVVLRDWTGKKNTGNLYLQPCNGEGGYDGVKNLQAHIIAEGSVFSFSGDSAELDAATGEPLWETGGSFDFRKMTDALSTCQLFVEGSISAKNTIGGAKYADEADQKLLIGGGVEIKNNGPEDLMRAQKYDVHFLRAFTGGLWFDVDGLPIDQSCGMGLSPSAINDIARGVSVIGDNGNVCDGIDSEAYFDPNSGFGGDLMPPQDTGALARGLDDLPLEDKYWPTYIFYRELPDSFLFQESGVWSLFGR